MLDKFRSYFAIYMYMWGLYLTCSVLCFGGSFLLGGNELTYVASVIAGTKKC